MKTCITCIHGLTRRSPCEDCLTPEVNGFYAYRNYEEGNPIEHLTALQRSGEREIVLGGEGEHTVSALWSYQKALEHLIDTCENVGGLTWRQSNDTIITDTYHGAFHLIYEEGKLRRIFKRSRSDKPLVHWWTSKPDFDNLKELILSADTGEKLGKLEKDIYTRDFDDAEKVNLMEYLRARIGFVNEK